MRLLCCMTAAMMVVTGISARAERVQSFDSYAHDANSRNTSHRLQGGKADATTPEPWSVALLGTGLLGFAGVMRRRFIP